MTDPVTTRLEALENAVAALTARLAEVEGHVARQADALRRSEETAAFVAARRRTIDRLHEQYEQQRIE